MKISKIYNRYELLAQYFPAVITSIPAFVTIFALKKSSWFSDSQSASVLTFAENVGLSFVAFFLLMQVQRFLAKYYLEKKLFADGIQLPTTQMLLLTDGRLSKNMKTKIRKRVLVDFNFTLYDENEEKQNLGEAVRLIIEAVALIRGMVKDGKLCINYNIQYGFFRNLIAGFFIAFPMSLINIAICIISPSTAGMVISSLTALFFGVLFLVRKMILTNLAESYAKNLFTEYISFGGEL